MFNTPYETTSAIGYQFDKLLLSIEKALILDQVTPTPKSGIFAILRKPETEGISIAPLPVPTRRGLVLDLRSLNVKELPHNLNIGNVGLLYRAACLQSIWMKNPEAIRTNSGLPLTIYTRWISGVLINKYSLDPSLQPTLKALAAWFYHCLSVAQPDVTEDSEIMALRLAREQIVPTGFNDLVTLFKRVGVIKNLQQFIDAIIEETQSPRLKTLNVQLFAVSLSNGWFGTPNSQVLVCVAAEYPPLFISMLYTALNESAYKASTIGTIARQTQPRDITDFTAAVNRLLAQD